jgi:hypothetical protein
MVFMDSATFDECHAVGEWHKLPGWGCSPSVLQRAGHAFTVHQDRYLIILGGRRK